MTRSQRPRRRSPREAPPAPALVLRRSRAKPARSGLGSLPAPPHSPGPRGPPPPPPPSRKRPPRRSQLSWPPGLDLASVSLQFGSELCPWVPRARSAPKATGGQDPGWGASGGVTYLLTGTLSWKNTERKRRWQSAQLLPRPSPTPFPADSPRASPWTLKAAAQCPIQLVPRLLLSWLSPCPYPARPPEGTTSCPGLLFLLPWSPPC